MLLFVKLLLSLTAVFTQVAFADLPSHHSPSANTETVNANPPYR